MILLIISIICLSILIGVVYKVKKSPVIETHFFWRFNQYKKCIEILTYDKIIYVKCASLKEARVMMENSDVQELV